MSALYQNELKTLKKNNIVYILLHECNIITVKAKQAFWGWISMEYGSLKVVLC